VSVSALLIRVPVVGRVRAVVPVVVKVVANAPEVTKLPPRVMVFVPLLIPVPPYVPAIIPPCQVPDVIVPSVVSDPEPAKGEAPMVLYDTVLAILPLNTMPETPPAPLLLNVNACGVKTVMLAEPLNDTPLIVLAVFRVVAVVAFPVSAAVIVPAAKLPDASRVTILDAVSVEVESTAKVFAKLPL